MFLRKKKPFSYIPTYVLTFNYYNRQKSYKYTTALNILHNTYD